MSAAEAEPELPRTGAGRRLDPETLGSHVERLYRAAYGLCGSRADAEDLRRPQIQVARAREPALLALDTTTAPFEFKFRIQAPM